MTDEQLAAVVAAARLVFSPQATAPVDEPVTPWRLTGRLRTSDAEAARTARCHSRWALAGRLRG